MVTPRKPFLYFTAAVVLAAFSLLTGGFRGMLPYLALAGIALFQALRPSVPGWAFVVVPYSAGAVLYSYALSRDAFRIVAGQRPRIFLNPTDSIVFGLVNIAAVCIAVLVLLAHPRFTAPPEGRGNGR